MNASAMETGDSNELEALFDSIAQGSSAAETSTQTAANDPAVDNMPTSAGESVMNRIGHMTRALHDSLRELGFDKLLQDAAQAIPDARDRLAYVATMTEQAAQRALTATETARPLQEALESEATRLGAQWDKLFANELALDDFKRLATETRGYLAQVPEKTRATNAQLLEIMMAQDFQDLTGQVIKRITELAGQLEQQLVDLLLESMPADKRAALNPRRNDSLLNGPVVNGGAAGGVVTSQDDVDNLLESLGF